MTPLRDWIVITPIEKPQGAIILQTEETTNKALVIKIGSGVKQIKPGDKIIHNKLGYEFKIGDEKVYLIQEGDVYAKT